MKVYLPQASPPIFSCIVFPLTPRVAIGNEGQPTKSDADTSISHLQDPLSRFDPWFLDYSPECRSDPNVECESDAFARDTLLYGMCFLFRIHWQR
jgi:hypothetical protein